MRFFIVVLALCLSACATLPDQLAGPRLDVTLSQDANEQWIVDIQLPNRVEAIAFINSQDTFREKHWTPLSSGTHIENINGIDTLWFDERQSTARFRLEHNTESVSRSLISAKSFGDGSIVFFSNEFYFAPIFSKSAIRKLNGSFAGQRGQLFSHTLTVNSKKPIFANGKRYTGTAKLPFGLNGNSAFFYVGRAPVLDTESFIGVFDANLPSWLSTRFSKNFETLLETLGRAWGEDLPEKPTILFSYINADNNRYSSQGAVISKRILWLRISGKAYEKGDKDATNRFLQVLAHEASHLFQGRSDSGSTSFGQSWIVEGAADVMAIYAMREAGFVDAGFAHNEYDASYESCLQTLSGSFGVGRSVSQGRFYDCGNMFALITDYALPDHSLFDFWNSMLERANGRDYNSKLYFKTMTSLGADPKIVGALREMTEAKIESPNQMTLGQNYGKLLTQTLMDVGVTPSKDAAGRVENLSWK